LSASSRQQLVEQPQSQPAEKETKLSRTYPQSGYMVRDGKPKRFFYLDHRTVDARQGIITDSYATPANVHDSIVYSRPARSPATSL
jgi:IS5 family transposase